MVSQGEQRQRGLEERRKEEVCSRECKYLLSPVSGGRVSRCGVRDPKIALAFELLPDSHVRTSRTKVQSCNANQGRKGG
jgi:hypothetical protein